MKGGVAVAYRREIEAAVDPRETRAILCRFVEAAPSARRGGLGPRARIGIRP